VINYYTWAYAYFDDYYLYLNLLNWEDSSFLLDTDFFFLFSLISESFSNLYLTTLVNSYYSFLDIWLLNYFNLKSYNLLLSFLFDLWLYINVLFIKSNLIFSVNNFDFLLYFLFLNYEVSFFVLDFNNWLNLYTIYFYTQSIYDTYYLKFYFSYLDYLTYLKWFFILFMFIFIFLNNIRFRKVGKIHDFFFSKIYFFLTSLGFENRVQVDLILLFLFFVIFIWIIVLMTFDDVYSEVVELFHFFLVFIFIFIIFYLLYKYSIHYYSFLENTVSDGYNTSFILKQMVRDVSNTFALFLRFFLLFFRLNIYDGLDDFLDSYYIFFCDFDEDSYLDENFFYLNNFFYYKDNHEDNIFYYPNEQDWIDDLFMKYFILWGKFFYFIFFILEELFRVALALYIFYLIIFEVHSVNLSYFEENFFIKKKL